MTDDGYRRADALALEKLAAEALAKAGVPEVDAVLTARMIVDADLRGIDTHGVMNLHKYYVRKTADGIINPRPRLEFRQGSDTTAVVDGDNGLGFVVGHAAMETAIAMAERHGTGWVSACNSNHSGAGTYYVLMAARRGMIGIHFSSGGSSVAAPGGRGKLIGNNVVAIAAPAGDHPPFVFDMAPTMSIANKAHLMSWKGEKYPEGFVIDGAGKPVVEPEGYFEKTSAVLPLGGDAVHGANKGFGLLLMSDLLTGVLSGDGGSLLRKKGAESHAFFALRIDGCVRPEVFEGLMEELIGKLHGAPVLEGKPQLRYPGERMDRTYRERSAEGIPLHPKIVEDLRAMCGSFGLDLDRIWK
jgi:LDH2 family malate/lactate/ureidoglycolate dehydrogenase